MNYVLDLAAAAAVIVCVLVGSRRGAVRMIIAAVGYIAALAAAVFVSGAADEYVYDTFVSPAVNAFLEERAVQLENEYFSDEMIDELLAENGIPLDREQLRSIINGDDEYSEVLTNEGFRDKLNNMFIGYCRALTDTFSGVLPEDILNEAERYIDETDMENQRKLELLAFDKKSAVKLIESEIIRPGMLKTVRMVLFFLTFALVSLVFAMISSAVRAVRGISAIRKTDDFLGGILGLFQGIIVAALMGAAAGIFIKLTSDGNQYINSGVIAETMIFKRAYSGTLFLLSLILK